MDATTALDRLMLGAHEISQKRAAWEKRDKNYRGEQQRPFAPEGVNHEYESIQDQAMVNVLGLAMDTPVQRIDVEGFKKGNSTKPDTKFWQNVWLGNGLVARQRLVWNAMMVHDFGVLGTWANVGDQSKPIVRVENGKRIHIEPEPGDAFRAAWSVKTYTERLRKATSLVLPAGVTITESREVGYVYDATTWHRFERDNGAGQWRWVREGANPLGEQPFDQFSLNVDADGGLHPSIDPLIPQQNAINTIRFNTLLAMQFSAYRQRVFTGYDPVLRDKDGQPMFEMNTETGQPVIDPRTNLPKPLLNSPGRIGVDRALVFPGKDTKVFDLPESNLNNYITVLTEFLSQFFATAQIPPQYLLNKMANLSGDALAGAESTLQALISDIWQVADEGLVRVAYKATRAAGQTVPSKGYSVIRGDGEVRSFAQTVDAIVKLVSINFPEEAAFELIPGATPDKVADWVKMREEQDERQLAASMKAIAGADPVVGD